MDKKRLKDLYAQGEQADELLKEGRTRDALKALAKMSEEIEKIKFKTVLDSEKFYRIALIAWNMAVLRQQGLINKTEFDQYISGNAREVFVEYNDVFEKLIQHKIKDFSYYMGIIRGMGVRKEGETYFVKVVFSHSSQKAYEAETKYGWPVFFVM